MNDDLSALVSAAQGGSKEALDSLVRAIQRPIYNLALRMLQRPADAEDATQEVLIKLITHLSQFRGESAFSTWMYRVASNHLLNQRRHDADMRRLSFDGLAERLDLGLAAYEDGPEEAYEQRELIEETRRSCTLGMLQCLDPADRLAVILADILEVSGTEGATIMELSPAAYRKRLSRARQSLVAFVAGQCGIVNPASPCRCHKLAQVKRAAGLVQLQYEQPLGEGGAEALAHAKQTDLDAEARTAALLRAHPTYIARADLAARIERIVSAGRYGTQRPPTA
jgi:RNA polymerase sigma factor (sigma-70 family)